MAVKPTTIFWKKECGIKTLTNEEFNKKIEDLKNCGYIEVQPSTNLFDYDYLTYSIKEQKPYRYLAVVHERMEKEFFGTNIKDDHKNKPEYRGVQAFKAVSDDFMARTGLSLTKAFGTTQEEFKTCIPRQFYYINDKYVDRVGAKKPIKHCSAIDYCSQYPSMLCGRLPEFHCRTTIKYKGTVEPTPTYPFAFYVKSGHVAEYGVFDTHDWCHSIFKAELLGYKENEKFNGDPYLDPEEDETILMKASPYSLEPEMQKYYAIRKENPVAKLVMNAFIGFLHKNKYTSHKQAHIAAIVIARANERMRTMAEKIQSDIGYDKIIHICVDGCIYQSANVYGNEHKALKELNQEFTDCELKIMGTNCFVAMKDNQVVKFRHGAYDQRTDGKDIEQCDGFEDMWTWMKRGVK